MSNKIFFILLFNIVLILSSCSSSKNISTNYYHTNKKVLNGIESSYKALYSQKQFALLFTDKTFEKISIDIITDSLKYVYVFGLNEKARMNDTLIKYGLNVSGTGKLIQQMKSIRCTWINNLDYYVNGTKNSMIFMSIRQLSLNLPFIPLKYYILTYFTTQQYFDEDGRLLDGRKLKSLRKINGDIFMRINDMVCYTVSNSFR